MIGAYTISQTPVEWRYRIPWHNEVDNSPIDKYARTDQYLQYLVDKRNKAVEYLLEKWPETTDVMCCDSSYVDQHGPIETLVYDYMDQWRQDSKPVLGAAIYGPWRQRAKDVLCNRYTWSDPWGVPSLAGSSPSAGMVRANGVSGVHIFPLSIWKQGVRYGRFQNRNDGTETTWLARRSGLPIYIDMDAMFYRDRRFSRVKCLRISMGIGTKMRRVFRAIH